MTEPAPQSNPQPPLPAPNQAAYEAPYQAPYQQAPYQVPPPPPGQAPYRRLTRTAWDAPISGVCGGIARYLGVDPTLVRVVTVIAAILTFPAALIAYVVLWAVIPREQ